MLFETKQRNRLSPMKQGEDEYSYYDASGRPPFAVYRDLVNRWIGRVPQNEQAALVSRFRNKKSASYQATLSELVIHEAILRQGLSAELHPLGGHPTNRLDYKVYTAAKNPLAFVEVTSIAPAEAWVASNNREARIYNAIDGVKLPAGWRLSYSLDRAGTDSPAMGPVCKAIREWATESAAGDPSETPVRVFEAGEWRIELTLLGGFDPSSDDDRAIAGAFGQIRLLTPHLKIRQAVETKGSKYGQLNAPFLIVVADCKDELGGGPRNAMALLDAMFGSVLTRFVKLENGETICREDRADDGYWGVMGAARHQNVSGVMLIPKPNLWHLRDDRSQPIIVRNPWAAHPLPDDFFPLPSFNIKANGEITLSDGQSLADLLDLPTPWPPEG
jgi:hypothetical protein